MDKANNRQNKFMTLTPLHVAFVWVLKPRFKKLHFAALTMGAVIPDIEPLIAWIFGWSVFCGLDFPCHSSPDRLVLHSITGALTIDVVLTIIFVKIIGKLGVEKLGIYGFTNVNANAALFGSAAIGSLSHRSEEHTSELQSRQYLVCRLLLEKKKNNHLLFSLHIISIHSLITFLPLTT